MYSRKRSIRPSGIACAVALALGSQVAGALEITDITGEANPAQILADNLFVPGSGITVTGVELLGGQGDVGYGGEGEVPSFISTFDLSDPTFPVGQAGTYTNSTNTYGVPAGIILSSGDVLAYGDGPNTQCCFSGGAGTAADERQNTLLSENITGINQHFDVVEFTITFDVDAGKDGLTFLAAFGSEEWPDFVDSNFIDGFGIFLNGQNIAGVLPAGSGPGDPLLPVNINHPDFADVRGTELNGMLAPDGDPLLRFDAPLTPGSTGNELKFIIGDAGDGGYDSTVYLSNVGSEGSSPFIPILPDPNNPTDENGAFIFELPEVQPEETIWIDPPIATGYVYTETTGNALFATVTAPPAALVPDTDGYMLEYEYLGVTYTAALGVGAQFDFRANGAPDGVSTFTLTGIDEALMLDPTDSTVFATGLSFTTGGFFAVTQQPIITNTGAVPLPATGALFGIALTGLMLSQRRRLNS